MTEHLFMLYNINEREVRMKATLSEKNTRMNIVISKELKEQLETQAELEMRSASNLVCVAVQEYIKNHKK